MTIVSQLDVYSILKHPQDLLSFFDALFNSQKHHHIVSAPSRSWPVMQPHSRPFQTNDVDCGVFVCAYAHCRSTQVFDSFDFAASDIPQIRKEIKQQLAEYVHD